ncbi:uncharacterized membrane protein YbhN (UPF0104 family) [Catalinimonas alkaloidigena]|uniref:lysylphosphatidylglycerol synthase transmembrane domain-containing protein n=1 Tax=Catalinimonas alkaloidigena TaxID=1075417 RepID=UPI0024062BB3|nr:lysylphosphatidylglycerol synthase transmembrane domain-containing protein [Catalinimonas alkaloidigena]MDF9795705.1 uncharacterized membrane protein YbhN (UPF0104 family) [Catalinimonas alkaloidigena]
MEKLPVPQKAYKRYLKLLLKLGLTTLALYLVFRKVNIHEVWQILKAADIAWLIPALLLFILSKLFNAIRLQAFFSCIGLYLNTFFNIKLYMVGMFYNLFLPGGMGGDGYKIVILRRIDGVSTRGLITASLLDRVSGVVALGLLTLIALFFSQIYASIEAWSWLIWLGIIFAFPLYYLGLKILFPKFTSIYWTSSLYSIAVQVLTLGSVLSILFALNISSGYADYYVFFMLAALAAMLPFTIGGVGAREAVLVYAPQLFGAELAQDTALTLGLLFFLITTITSLSGAFVKLESLQDVTESVQRH